MVVGTPGTNPSRWAAAVRRYSPLVILSGAIGTALVVAVVGDVYRKVRQERRREVEELVRLTLASVARAVSDIVAPEPTTQLPPQRVVNGVTPESTASVSPYARPAWGDPVQFGEDPDPDGLDDPTDLLLPNDVVPLMAAASLDGSMGPFDPVPEMDRVSGPGRIAAFGVGENPLEDIGERPAWEEEE